MKKQKLVLGLVSVLVLAACSPSEQSSTLNVNGDSIIGGREVEEGEAIIKSIVAVYDAAGGQLCTGSLLENNLVLTAAHCVTSDQMYIFFDRVLEAGSISRKVDKAAISPYWATNQDHDTNTGDVAVLHFKGTIPLGYEPATFLKSKRSLRQGRQTILAGYGMSNGVTGEGAGILRMTTVSILNPSFSETEVIVDQQFGNGACHGDSGGPAYILANGKYYLWGITSRGVEDPDNNCSKFAAYTNALEYLPWIKKVAKSLSETLINPELAPAK